MPNGGGCAIGFIRVSLFLVSSPDNPEYSTTRSIIIRCGLLLLRIHRKSGVFDRLDCIP